MVYQGESFEVTPLALIHIAFSRQPEIKSSFQRYKSEEARYDFFVASRDSLTPRVRTSNSFGESRADETVSRVRNHTVEFSIEKEFFDTTQLGFGVGFRTNAVDEAIGYRPFVSANLRYPLWVSRQKLERTSEEIFRRNELNDAQLNYIQLVRRRLQTTLFRFYEVLSLQRRLGNLTRWREDLQEIRARLDEVQGRDVADDRVRTDAEHTRVGALIREIDGRLRIQVERLKSIAGLPFHAKLTLIDGPFDPFEGASHDELLRLSIETDPEIATLRNEQRNAEVQLDLARRGRWDVALLLNGSSDLEGGGEADGISNWDFSFGVDVSVVDPRVTDSLTRQAQARISRFKQAIISRENDIFVDTFEPVVRIETLSKSRDDLIENLPRFQEDYDRGLEALVAGELNIDDLLKRRQSLLDQEQEISRLTFLVGANVAELCSATGKFFELLEEKQDSGTH